MILKIFFVYFFYITHLFFYLIIYLFFSYSHNILHYILLYLIISYELQYINNIIILYQLFKQLNYKLIQQIIYIKKLNKNGIQFNNNQSSSNENEKHFQLWELCDIHWTLCQTIEHNINGNYSFRLLGIIIMMFLALLEMPFLIAVSLFNGQVQDAIMYTGLFSLNVMQLVSLTYSCALTTDEANNTKNIVCEYLTPDTNPKLIHQLKIMESQLSAHKADFDAAGIFELQRSFIAWMVGAITTYLVIFIQLQESSVWNIPKTAIWAGKVSI